MASLPILAHRTEWTPVPGRPPASRGARWRVEVEGWGVLLVDLARDEALSAGMAPAELDDLLPTALQRYAAVKLDDRVPVLDQLGRWESPIELRAEHFRP